VTAPGRPSDSEGVNRPRQDDAPDRPSDSEGVNRPRQDDAPDRQSDSEGVNRPRLDDVLPESEERARLLEVCGLERRLGSGAGGFRLTVPEFALSAGDRVAVVGPSGAGKSTFLAILALALRPDRAAALLLRRGLGGPLVDAGRLWARGDEAGLAALRAGAIGYVPQTAGLLPFLTLRRNIRLTQELAGRPDPGLVEALAARLEIAGALDRLPGQVSVGQRQRAAVARALAHRPAVVLADEPTASVHPSQADEVLRLLRDTAEAGAAVLISTHDLARAAAAGLTLLGCVPEEGSEPASVLRPLPAAA
jgi:putative ABC transport system ATP-binding protein